MADKFWQHFVPHWEGQRPSWLPEFVPQMPNGAVMESFAPQLRGPAGMSPFGGMTGDPATVQLMRAKLMQQGAGQLPGQATKALPPGGGMGGAPRALGPGGGPPSMTMPSGPPSGMMGPNGTMPSGPPSMTMPGIGDMYGRPPIGNPSGLYHARPPPTTMPAAPSMPPPSPTAFQRMPTPPPTAPGTPTQAPMPPAAGLGLGAIGAGAAGAAGLGGLLAMMGGRDAPAPPPSAPPPGGADPFASSKLPGSGLAPNEGYSHTSGHRHGDGSRSISSLSISPAQGSMRASVGPAQMLPPPSFKASIGPAQMEGAGGYTVQKGDWLSKIAGAMLGPNATPEAVNAMVGQIAQMNAIQDPNKIDAGQQLQLPGAAPKRKAAKASEPAPVRGVRDDHLDVSGPQSRRFPRL